MNLLNFNSLNICINDILCSLCIVIIIIAVYDSNVRDNAGLTPLHYAARFGNHGALTILLATKADPTMYVCA